VRGGSRSWERLLDRQLTYTLLGLLQPIEALVGQLYALFVGVKGRLQARRILLQLVDDGFERFSVSSKERSGVSLASGMTGIEGKGATYENGDDIPVC